MILDCLNKSEKCNNVATCPCVHYEVDDEFQIDVDEAIEIAHKTAETSGMSYEEYCKCQSDYRETTLNNNIQTCYRYLDFIEDFLDNYDRETRLAVYDVDYDEALWHLRYILSHIIKENRN